MNSTHMVRQPGPIPVVELGRVALPPKRPTNRASARSRLPTFLLLLETLPYNL